MSSQKRWDAFADIVINNYENDIGVIFFTPFVFCAVTAVTAVIA